jgi:1-acyl-sn-glycerol-3-phosphate acyltransferase
MNPVLDWLARARGFFSAKDLVSYVHPPAFAKKVAGLARKDPTADEGERPGDDLDARDPEFVRLIVDLFRALGERYFRWDVEGVEHVPHAGPALLVGNHNGGMQVTDSFLTFVAIWDRFGPLRAIRGLAHDLAFDDPVLAKYAAKFGVLRAGHANAHRAFERGDLVLVYPGSDLDSFRSFRDRNRIELGGRRGFVRLALRAGVPIVPVVSAGTHEQFVVLTRGEKLAKRIGFKKLFRAEVLPIVFSLPWGITLGFVPYLPLPAQTTLAFGEPIHFPDLGPEAADDEAAVDACYRRVEAEMQAILDRITAGRRPFFGRVRAPAGAAPQDVLRPAAVERADLGDGRAPPPVDQAPAFAAE